MPISTVLSDAASLACAFLFTGDPSSDIITGAGSAETALLKALIRYGRFHRIDVFGRGLSSGSEDFFGASSSRTDVRFFGTAELPTILREAVPDVGFCPFPLIWQLAQFRDFADRPFPIIGFVHTLAHLDIRSGLERNLRSVHHDHDVALCPSMAIAKTLEKMLDGIISDFPALAERRPAIVDCRLGIDVSEFSSRNKQAARSKLDLPESEMIMLYAGRLSLASKTDLLPLVAAFAALPPRNRDLLLIVGQQQQEGTSDLLLLHAQSLGVDDRLVILDGSDRATVVNAFVAADIFISPSDNIQESFGLTILEAMAAGLAIVASDWNGYRSIIDHDETGLLIPTWSHPPDPEIVQNWYYRPRSVGLHMAELTVVDPVQMAAHLRNLRDDPAKRRSLGQNARNKVQSHDWPHVVKQVAEIIQDATDAPIPIREPCLAPMAWDVWNCFDHYPGTGLPTSFEVVLTRHAEKIDFRILQRLAGLAGLDWASMEEILDGVGRSGRLTIQSSGSDSYGSSQIRATVFLIKHMVLERKE